MTLTATATPRYTRAFSTLGCPELSLRAAQALARAHDIRAVELRALGGSVDLPGVLARAEAAGDIPAAPDTAVSIFSLGTDLRLFEATAGDREALLRFAPWAERLGAARLRVFDGGRNATPDEFARARATVDWWRQERSAHGWTTDLMVETHDALANSSAIRRFVEAVPGVAILWDTHHTWRVGGEAPLATWRAIGRHVVHIHVKDSSATSGGSPGHRYVLPGAGEFPMRELRAALAGDYTGPLSLEWERLWHPELPPLADALAAAEANHWW